MQHGLFFKALFAFVALGLYNFFRYEWTQPTPVIQLTNPITPSSVLSSEGWDTGFAEHQTTSNLTYYKFTGQMEQSPNDQRQHQLIRLSNNMVVLCTSDPESSDSAATLSINVGSMAESKELLGMAHFLEHMLFMGSTKYPVENEYTSYISNNLGKYNAYTADTQTTYYFSVSNLAFDGALDRFSRFFIDPLLSADGVDREVNAVHSEYKGNLQNDIWRLHELMSSLCNQSHPYSQFSIGNLETLKEAAHEMGVSLHDKVSEFYQQYYSADIMKLTVVGNHSVEQLVDWAVEKFSMVESKGDTKPELVGHPLDQTSLGKLVHMESISNMNIMFLQFALPEIKSLYQDDPAYYISTLLSGESKGSLLSYLKQKGWATSFHGHLGEEYDGFNIFPLAVSLTPEGLLHYEQVLEAMFAYLQMLRDLGPQERIHSEMKAINNMKFEYYERPEALGWALETSSDRHNQYVIPEHYLTKDSVVRDFNASIIADILQYFNPQNYNVLLVAQNHTGVECTETEKYFGTHYKVSDLPAHLVSNTTTFDYAKYGFHLPAANTFLPENTQVVANKSSVENIANSPNLIQLNTTHELWFKQDGQFFTPRGSIYLKIKLANAAATKLNALTALILNQCLYEKLNGEFDSVYEAGMEYMFDISGSQLLIHVRGFNDKLPYLMTTLLDRIKTFAVEQHTYDMVMIDIRKSLENIKFDHPFKLLNNEKADQLNEVPYISSSTLEQLLDEVTIEAVQEHVDNLFTSAYFKMLVVGNFEEADAVEAAQQVNQLLDTQPLADNSNVPIRNVDIEPGHYIHRYVSEDPDMPNNAVLSTFYCGMASSPKDRMVIALLSQMVHDQFFDQLRTKEQLGYSVFATTNSFDSGKLVLKLIVQGESNPMYLIQRIDSFVASFHTYIAAFSEEKFDSLIGSIISKASEKPTSVANEAELYWKHISSGTYNFDYLVEGIAKLKNISLGDVQAVWNMYVNPETAVEYTRVDSHMWSPKLSYPTDQDLAIYPEGILALYGCLESEGLTGISIPKLHSFVQSASMANGIDVPLDTLASMYASLNNTSAVDKISADGSCIKTALEMALSPNTHVSMTQKTATNFANIGMVQTPEGKWIINNLEKFKAVQPLFALPVPNIKLAANATCTCSTLK